MRHVLQIVASVLALLTLVARAQAEPVPPVAKSIKANETAILLVDFQANFVSPDGAWYGKFAEHYKKTRMLERTVELVGNARAKGVLIVHITEGYTQDYRELDPANPGGFHRGQIGRGAWKIGSKEAAYYEPLKPIAGDRDLFLPPRPFSDLRRTLVDRDLSNALVSCANSISIHRFLSFGGPFEVIEQKR